MRLWIGLHLPRLSLEVFTPSWSTDTGSVVLEQERVPMASAGAGRTVRVESLLRRLDRLTVLLAVPAGRFAD